MTHKTLLDDFAPTVAIDEGLGNTPKSGKGKLILLSLCALGLALAASISLVGWGYTLGKTEAANAVKQARQLAANERFARENALRFTRYIKPELVEAAKVFEDNDANAFVYKAAKQYAEINQLQVNWPASTPTEQPPEPLKTLAASPENSANSEGVQ